MNGKAMFAFVIPLDGTPVDPGYGRPGWSPVDPGFGGGRPGGADPGYGQGGGFHPDNSLPGGGYPSHGLPGSPGHPGNALPIPPVRPSPPIVLPPGGSIDNTLPPHVDNTLPPGAENKPIVIPPDPSIGIELPIVLPQLPPGSALLIALPASATPKEGAPANSKPAILVQPGKKPVLVYVSAGPQPK